MNEFTIRLLESDLMRLQDSIDTILSEEGGEILGQMFFKGAFDILIRTTENGIRRINALGNVTVLSSFETQDVKRLLQLS